MSELSKDDLDLCIELLTTYGQRLAELGVRLSQGTDLDWIHDEVIIAVPEVEVARDILGKPKRKAERRKARQEVGLTQETIIKLEAWDEMVERGPL